MRGAASRRLPAEVQIGPGGQNLELLWDRFELFEALHHDLDFALPISTWALTDIADRAKTLLSERLAPSDDSAMVLDAGCGSGGMLLKIGADVPITALGIDLSPWMLKRAALNERAASLSDATRLTWRLGDAKSAAEDCLDLLCCLGASWIWHDHLGVAREAQRRLTPGGLLLFGDVVTSSSESGISNQRFSESCGRLEADFARRGFRMLARHLATGEDVDVYCCKLRRSLDAWSGAPSVLDEGADWIELVAERSQSERFAIWLVEATG